MCVLLNQIIWHIKVNTVLWYKPCLKLLDGFLGKGGFNYKTVFKVNYFHIFEQKQSWDKNVYFNCIRKGLIVVNSQCLIRNLGYGKLSIIEKCLGTTQRLVWRSPLIQVSRGESPVWKCILMSSFLPKHVLPSIKKGQLKYNMYGNKRKRAKPWSLSKVFSFKKYFCYL